MSDSESSQSDTITSERSMESQIIKSRLAKNIQQTIEDLISSVTSLKTLQNLAVSEEEVRSCIREIVNLDNERQEEMIMLKGDKSGYTESEVNQIMLLDLDAQKQLRQMKEELSEPHYAYLKSCEQEERLYQSDNSINNRHRQSERDGAMREQEQLRDEMERVREDFKKENESRLKREREVLTALQEKIDSLKMGIGRLVSPPAGAKENRRADENPAERQQTPSSERSSNADGNTRAMTSTKMAADQNININNSSDHVVYTRPEDKQTEFNNRSNHAFKYYQDPHQTTASHSRFELLSDSVNNRYGRGEEDSEFQPRAPFNARHESSSSDVHASIPARTTDQHFNPSSDMQFKETQAHINIRRSVEHQFNPSVNVSSRERQNQVNNPSSPQRQFNPPSNMLSNEEYDQFRAKEPVKHYVNPSPLYQCDYLHERTQDERKIDTQYDPSRPQSSIYHDPSNNRPPARNQSNSVWNQQSDYANDYEQPASFYRNQSNALYEPHPARHYDQFRNRTQGAAQHFNLEYEQYNDQAPLLNHNRMNSSQFNAQPHHRTRQLFPSQDHRQAMLPNDQHLQPHIGTTERLLDAIQAPAAKIPTFNGDAVQYHRFIMCFTNSVEAKLHDNAARLNRLVQYCSGKALAIVSGCLAMDPDQGYPTAKRLLRERFGTPVRVASAWVSHIMAQDKVKADDGQGLQAFADTLRMGYHTLEAVGALAELAPQQILASIIGKLPEFLQRRWRREVVHIQGRQGRMISYSDVVKFTEGAAEEMNLPGYVTSKAAANPGGNRRDDRRDRGGIKSFAVETDSSDVCVVCGEDHRVGRCEKFQSKSVGERRALARQYELCYNCLGVRHKQRDCKSKFKCRTCGKAHHTLLHPMSAERDARPNSNPPSNPDEKRKPETAKPGGESSGLVRSGKETRVALPVCAVQVRAPDTGRTLKAYALLDPGSTATFCSKELARRLGARGKATSLELSTLNEAKKRQQTESVRLELIDEWGNCVHALGQVYTQATIPVGKRNVLAKADVERYPHLAQLSLPSVEPDEVSLLIGQNNSDCLCPLEVASGEAGEPYAIRSKLGWSCHGALEESNVTRDENAFNIGAQVQECCTELQEKVDRLWELEANVYDDAKAMSVSDKKVLELWQGTTTFEEGRFVMAIPFKEDKPQLPSSTAMAESRLASLKKKLERNPDLRKQYVERMQDVIQKGYAETVPAAELRRCDGRVWTIPHHAVINPNKSKIRIVYDCAAKTEGQSLNNHVYQGPDQVQKLVGVLLRFRLGKIGISADIAEMYYQVAVKEEDRDALRFLWWPGGNLERKPQVYRMTRQVFGGTWAPSCCTTALQYAVNRFDESNSQEKTRVLQSFYVDDYLRAEDCPEQLKTNSLKLQESLAKAGFKLTKWNSSNPKVLTDMKEENISPVAQGLCLGESMPDRALGVMWFVKEDELGYKTTVKKNPYTKRGILSTLSSVYDPLGVASPFILKARLLVQELCRKQVTWDEEVQEEYKRSWDKWMKMLPEINGLVVPRCAAAPTQVKIAQLHHYCDASSLAYGVASYLVTQDKDGTKTSMLMMAKSRLAPIKTLSIPRLELLACTLGARQDQLIRREVSEIVNLEPSQWWTDSMIVLQYIKSNDKRFQTFVANRLEVIREHTSPEQWHHVDTSINPADDCSRGVNPERLRKSRWLNGPEELTSEHEFNWPLSQVEQLSADDEELKKTQVTVLTSNSEKKSPIRTLLDYYSDWHAACRGLAWLRLCGKVLAKRLKPRNKLLAADIDEAEVCLLREAQHEVFSAELTELKGDGVVSKSSKLTPLCPLLSSNLIRTGGRIDRAPVGWQVRHPIILPEKHPVTTLLVRQSHQQLGHAGREHVLAHLRQRFWIINGRSAVRSELSKCIPCKKREGPPVTQQMSELPADRIQPGGHPFSKCGVDLFGPFHVRYRRGTATRHGCLFTCLVTRAVHLEVVYDLSGDAFLQALQRMTARRGQVEVMRSDNGRNFVRAERELQRNLRHWSVEPTVGRYLSGKGIEWKFNPPYASSHGGVWERQIRTVRRTIAGLCQDQRMSDEGLNTLFCVVESIVNSRPLTTVSADANDCEALTPNHLLIPQVKIEEGSMFRDPQDQGRMSRRQLAQVNHAADVFWSRWLKQYLPTLQSRQKWQRPERSLKRNDIVLVSEPNLPRATWRLGRVVEPPRGSERSARVRTSAGVILRPIQRLYLLEGAKE